jgi:hypothetical protein
MPRLSRTAFLVAVVALLAGCDAASVTAAADEVLVAVTDRAEYERVGGVATITVSLRNRGSHVVEVVGCPEPPALEVEQRADASWSAVGSANLYCTAINLTRTVRLDPGAELVSRIHLAQPGEYRARIYIGAFSARATASVVTAAFRVR